MGSGGVFSDCFVDNECVMFFGVVFSPSFSLLLFLFFFFLNEKEAKNQEKEISPARAGAAPFLFRQPAPRNEDFCFDCGC